MAGYGDFSYYYDLLTENVDYEKRCEYICGLLAENGISEGILLDLACGTGTMSLLFAEKGYDVVGVDGSEEMLTQAQEKKMESGADIIFLCQKMEELDLFGTIQCAVSTLDTFNHIDNIEKIEKDYLNFYNKKNKEDNNTKDLDKIFEQRFAVENNINKWF